MTQPTDPLAHAYSAYEQLESRLSKAMDQLVATNGFAEMFTTSASTVLAATRIMNGVVDEAVRATRLAARQDVTALARQLARNEDKLERVLQLLEDVSDRVAELERTANDTGTASKNGSGSAGSQRSTAARRRPAAKRTQDGAS